MFTKNKPSFCSGSCDEIRATKNLSNKTSLKHSWNTLEAFVQIVLKHTNTFFETSSKHLWTCLNSLLTPFTRSLGIEELPKMFNKNPYTNAHTRGINICGHIASLTWTNKPCACVCMKRLLFNFFGGSSISYALKFQTSWRFKLLLWTYSAMLL